MPEALPINAVLNKLNSALSTHNNVILMAAPGAGKSTVAPLHLLQNLTSHSGKILLTQPRRLAVKSVANRLASLLNEKLGGTVGYRMRMDSRVSTATRLEVITEGVLLRTLQDDPELSDVDLIIFDEIHERSLNSDLCLSLCLDVQHGLREDLKLLAMSATIDSSELSSFLPGSRVISCEAPMFPVSIRYRPTGSVSPHATDYAKTCHEAVAEHKGNILVFLPGIAEIRSVSNLLDGSLPDNIELVPLYGGLSIQEQQKAIQPTANGMRKVVLATSIAETSLTIEGITVVIDGGQNRYQQHNPANGLNCMRTRKNSSAGAEQRRGRAGRLGPGSCYRLWSESERREQYNSPEILQADLAPLALQIARWGVTDPGELSWLNTPPTATLQQSRELLISLGALDSNFRITAIGSRISKMGLHPRLGKMLLVSSATASFHKACLLATILNEAGSNRYGYQGDDLEQLLIYCADSRFVRSAKGQRLSKLSRKLHAFGTLKPTGEELGAGELLASAYPDRIAQKRSGSRNQYKMANGRGAVLKNDSNLLNTPYIVISDLDARKGDAKIFQAAAVSPLSIEQLFTDRILEKESISLDEASGVFVSELQTCFNQLVLRSKKSSSTNTTTRSRLICEYVRTKGLQALNWSDNCKTWQARVSIVQKNYADSLPKHLTPLPNVDDESLLSTLEDWLQPWLKDIGTTRALQKLEIRPLLSHLLNWEQQTFVDIEAPTHYLVASGSKIKLSYIENDLPILAARIQELFSTRVNPSICSGRQTLLIHLLSPGRRPVQITSDLAGFWQSSYVEVKKEMKGRYPKHHWPDDPANTQPHSSVKPKR